MADYGSRLASLKSEQTRLAKRQAELIAQRRDEIGRLAERLGVLEAEDELLSGVLLELRKSMDTHDPRLAQWRDAGARFRSGKSERAQPDREGAALCPNGTDPTADA
jgi:hypothetical protein